MAQTAGLCAGCSRGRGSKAARHPAVRMSQYAVYRRWRLPCTPPPPRLLRRAGGAHARARLARGAACMALRDSIQQHCRGGLAAGVAVGIAAMPRAPHVAACQEIVDRRQTLVIHSCTRADLPVPPVISLRQPQRHCGDVHDVAVSCTRPAAAGGVISLVVSLCACTSLMRPWRPR